eukprot:CAMPEP_0114658424 /NCGR_PEP_ID=MMETSP0191-20121206/15713_1 /TAXON_ID=126664 /ORGANISM="Sorites sp." /LENGTH=103 /DNA_ID=CAMNT_0001880391 /DNA_START=1095 /DNA_END=1406 /DNA_ORIENTATION=-
MNPSTKDKSVEIITRDEADKGDYLKDKSGVTLDVVGQSEFLEWLADNYKTYGTTLEFVTDKSSEGAQFVKGFGGIGGMLRWAINWAEMDDYYGFDDDDDDAWI